MTKTRTKQTITFETIIEAFDNNSVPEARKLLYNRIGAKLCICGTIENKITRDGGLKIFIKPDGLPENKTFMIFADFNEETEREKARKNKIRKGSKISFTGDFRTAGYAAATKNNCSMKQPT